jgi:hypothetical protein
MRAEANFLNSESYAFDLPDVLDPTPNLESVVTLDDRPRTISYMPYSRRVEPHRHLAVRHRFDVRTSFVPVSVYETLDGSNALVAYWRFPDGSLSTFMQDDAECGADLEVGIRTVIANTTVRISKRNLPTISLRPPLRGGDLRNPFERDLIVYWPRADRATWPTIKVTREPTWITQGRRTSNDGEFAVGAVTTALGITIACSGPSDQAPRLEEYAMAIASSAAPIH